MDLLGIVELFPVEFSMALTAAATDHDLVADVRDATGVVRDDQAYDIYSGRIIDMGWVSSIALCSIAENPMIGDDIVVAGRRTMEMDFQVIALCGLPGKSGFTFGANGFHDHFMAYIIDTAGIVCNGQADHVGAGLLVGMIWV